MDPREVYEIALGGVEGQVCFGLDGSSPHTESDSEFGWLCFQKQTLGGW